MVQFFIINEKWVIPIQISLFFISRFCFWGRERREEDVHVIEWGGEKEKEVGQVVHDTKKYINRLLSIWKVIDQFCSVSTLDAQVPAKDTTDSTHPPAAKKSQQELHTIAATRLAIH